MFRLGRIGRMTVKNRLVMPPMVRNYGDGTGMVTKRYVEHIARIAKGGVGMMLLEASYIRPDGKGFVHELGIHSEATIPGLRKLVNAAHAQGAKIGIQLYHAGRQTSSKTTKKQPVAPSPIPDPTVQEVPHELTVAEIKQLVVAYGRAADRAKRAGMDTVEIHGAHGYLITQFLSPFSNHRTDAYGGSFKNRLRFMEEVYESVRNAVGAMFPVILRLSGEEMVPGGLTLKDTIAIAKRAEELGVDALHISVGNYASYARGYMIPPMAIEDGPLLRLSAAVKKAVSIPVIAVGKLRSPDLVDTVIRSKQADFVAIGRTLLADPDWPKKVRTGQVQSINPCIACNQGCISRLFAQQDVWCTVNAETGREGLFTKRIGRKKNVLVIGGGPAGLTAAKIAAQRGHRVTLYEKRSKLGGQVTAAASLPYRKDWTAFLRTLIRDVKVLGVTIYTNVEFGSSSIAKGEYDAAIIAMGSSPVKPNIPGVGRTNVVVARDIVEGWATASGRVVVAGGGCLGAQISETLAVNGHPVTIVEATGAIAHEAPIDERALLLARLKGHKVKTITESKIMSIGSASVAIEGPGGASNIPADTVVLCLGALANDGLTSELKKLVKKVAVVGDAKQPRRVTEAVSEGALAALSL